MQVDQLSMSSNLPPTDPPTNSPLPSSSNTPLVYQSADLLQGRREVWIEHGDEMYRLRLTNNGKLYLTK